jgi:hypothetical protein
MRVAAIPDTRFVDPREYEMKADYVLESLSEIPALIRRVNARGTKSMPYNRKFPAILSS